MLIAETHIASNSILQSLRDGFGWRITSCARRVKPSAIVRRASGGVAVVNANPSAFALTLISADPCGAIAVEVASRTRSARPFVAVAAYVSPVGSPYEADNADVHAFLRRAALQAQQTHNGEFIIGIDANARLGELTIGGDPRTSEDKRVFNHGTLMATLDATLLTPIHSLGAHTTSRAIAGRAGYATVDYLLKPRAWAAARAAALPPIPWDDVPTTSTHRPVTMDLCMLPSDTPVPAPPARPRRRWAHVSYGDGRWAEAARAITLALNGQTRLASVLRDPTATADDSYHAFEQVLSRALDSVMAAPCRHNERPRDARVYRHRERLPAPLAAFFHAARRARAARQLDRRNAALLAVADEARRLASRALRKYRRKNERGLRDNLLVLRTSDPRLFFQRIRRELAPDAPWIFDDGGQRTIPSEPGDAPAHTRFTAHFLDTFGTATSPPRAAGDISLLSCAKQCPEPRLGRPFVAADFTPLLFPHEPHPAVCPATGAAGVGCPLCDDATARAAANLGRYDMINAPAISGVNTINATAVCSGDLGAYHVTFPHGDRPTTAAYRIAVTTALAAVLNRALAEGRMPPAAATSTVIYLAKGARGAAALNPSATSSYRPITMGRMGAKVFGLALVTRLIHWIRTHKIVSTTTQGAFTAGLGGSFHAWALFEHIRHEWRNGRSVYVLFLDLKAAYDSVNVTTLYALLRHIGVPENLVSLLHTWALNRRSAVNVNGVLSELIAVLNGVGQGESAAPTLFAIFIQTLADRLAAAGLKCKVSRTATGIEIVFLFADDVAEAAPSDAQLRALATVTYIWTVDFGLTVNTKDGKSNCVAFPAPGVRLPPLLPVVLAPGVTIAWASQYRYLGLPATQTLSLTAITNNLHNTLTSASGQLNDYNGVIRRLNVATRVMLHKSLVLSKISYSLPFLDVINAVTLRVDRATFLAARGILRLFRRTPTCVLLTESGLPSATFLIVRARVNLALSLLHAAEQDVPAVRLFHSLAKETGPGLLTGRAPSWVHRTTQMICYFESLGVPPPVAQSRYQINSVSNSYARACALAALRVAEAAAGTVLVAPSTARPTRSAKARQHAADAYLSYGSTAAKLGPAGPATPLSALGPSCSGALLRLATRQSLNSGACSAISMLARARLGAASLTMPPYSPRDWLLDPDSEHGVAAPGDYEDSARGRPCPLCFSNYSADPWHLLNECPHPAVSGAAARCRRRLAAHVSVLCKLAVDAQKPYGAPATAAARVAQADVSAAVPLVDWSSADGAFLFFRLVLVLPFPAAVTDGRADACPLTSALGRLFDAVCVRDGDLRELANYWVDWSRRSYDHVATAWRDAVDAAAQRTGGPSL